MIRLPIEPPALIPREERERLIGSASLSKETGRPHWCIVKLFAPTGRYTFYAFEGEERGDDLILFGYCVSPLGKDCDEWGYVSLAELEEARGVLGLPIERDRWFKGCTYAAIERGERP